jgi:hypothetical protein
MYFIQVFIGYQIIYDFYIWQVNFDGLITRGFHYKLCVGLIEAHERFEDISKILSLVSDVSNVIKGVFVFGGYMCSNDIKFGMWKLSREHFFAKLARNCNSVKK